MENRNYLAIGVMSGTSLDGLDVAYCNFNYANEKWSYKILKALTFHYDSDIKKKLSEIQLQGAEDLALFNVEFGKWIGNKINDFIRKNSFKDIDFIASHGHTVFHQPEKNFTLQLGDGNAIAALTGYNVIYDFRSLDVALGGQGAPLVPIGDELLFPEYSFCLNLGGFANISFKENSKRIAFDICPANILLNFLANLADKEYDSNGEMAASGKLIKPLLENLNSLKFYSLHHPKSLGREWLENELLPKIDTSSHTLSDLLHTCCEHIAVQISAVLNKNIKSGKGLVTGGGAFNSFLIEKLNSKTELKIVIPDPEVINYKEALIFAFLGMLRMEKKINVLSAVTGASADSCSGVMVLRNDPRKS